MCFLKTKQPRLLQRPRCRNFASLHRELNELRDKLEAKHVAKRVEERKELEQEKRIEVETC